MPGLITGVFVLGTLEAVALAVGDELPKVRAISGGVLGVLGFGLVAVQVMAAHDKAPYADRPQGELTASLGDVAPAMRGVRTNPSVHTYVAQIRDCMARYPASRVAFLPDNAFVAPVFGVRNPFPMEWPLPMELTGDAPQRMVGAAKRLDREGDYLVLFPVRQGDRADRGPPGARRHRIRRADLRLHRSGGEDSGVAERSLDQLWELRRRLGAAPLTCRQAIPARNFWIAASQPSRASTPMP
ncbi:hypothetical protein [Amycolatopsis sp. SID8362]|uniref:hypothetical protein n=1 Tax=Amycolatopsis sp. SID8362 TaxID=2690346 RepID=UPI00136CDC90|nr:hypothetical protein [Amycolatopsis sp. SID8362]NBH11493.1 hypothetical protein [Amycolatopsis sp. SID8362]NED48186.1 hypothetical protein [Amycolatopsis sp. SID8362]